MVGGEAGGLEGDLIEIDCSAARTALLLSSTIESNAVLSNAELLPLLLPMLIARTETTGSLNAIRGVKSSFLDALQTVLVVCMDYGSVSPECLLPPQPDEKFGLKVVEIDGTITQYEYAVFDVHAFLSSPTVVGAAAVIALPTIVLLALLVAKLIAVRR